MRHHTLVSFPVFFFLITLFLSAESDQDKIASAKKLFDAFVTLGDNYDPKVADLYSDKAVVKTNRIYPDGSVKTMTIPSLQWKQLVRQVMPIAKERGDRSTFSKIQFLVEGNRVRIKAIRYSELKEYASPYSMLVGTENGKWLIFEEITETKP